MLLVSFNFSTRKRKSRLQSSVCKMTCTGKSDDYWDYNNPVEWGTHFPAANGLCQSPIDIDSHKTVQSVFPKFEFSKKYHSNELFKLINHGHQVTGTLADRIYGQNDTDLWFTGGGLEGTFYFVNFHLHWGRDDRHGSEHEIDGHQFPAEGHVVFKNREIKQTAVFAFLFTISDRLHKENKEWCKYADAASQLTTVDDEIQCLFNLHDLMNVNDRLFYRYTGSLTTPPCTEGVIWTIFSQKIAIQEESLNQLRKNILTKVYRPVQPLNHRIVYKNH